eukprot:jgi/Phyca11/535917/estExt2_fgenesh1_pg.C_PHYCAscaffold_430071
MTDADTKTWLKAELVSALGFAEVDEIVDYITSTFHAKQEASSYLVELLGIPAGRAEHISTRLFSPNANPEPKGAKGGAAAAAKQERLVPLPTAVNSRLKLRYEADAVTADQAAQQHMEELVRLDESGAERTRVIDAEQYFYDEENIEKNESGSTARRPVTMALDLDNKQFVDVKITRNEQLAKEAREVVDGVQRKMNKGKRGKGGLHQPTEAPDATGGRREALVVVDDAFVCGHAALDHRARLKRIGEELIILCSAPANPLWDFYACGLVDENDDCSEGEDTEDELETQDWILFQRQRAQARLANACQREAHVLRAAKH